MSQQHRTTVPKPKTIKLIEKRSIQRSPTVRLSKTKTHKTPVEAVHTSIEQCLPVKNLPGDRKGFICELCLKQSTTPLVKCDGHCNGFYHSKCLSICTDSTTKECTTTVKECNVANKKSKSSIELNNHVTCEGCKTGRRPSYGDIILAKYGYFCYYKYITAYDFYCSFIV